MLKLHFFPGVPMDAATRDMSNSSETEFDLELHFLPAWAKQPPQQNRYADFEGEGRRERRDDRGDRRDRPPRRDRERRDFSPSPRAEGGPRPPRRGGPPGRPDRRDDRRGPDRGWDRRGPAPQEIPLPELAVAFKPDDHGVDSLAKQIRMTGRAYPLFDIAQMILQKPERHSVTLSVKKKPDGAPAQPLFTCAIDETLWLSEDEALRYVLDKHFAMFYQPERTQVDPPKGTYTFVAQCGMSGMILGPPNYHDYQNQLRKLHAERFSRMPFEVFKARVKIVREETVVKQWIEEQSYKTEYACLNMPEPLKLASREEVAKHFREHHLANIIKAIESFELAGLASREVRNPQLRRLIRARWEEQRRFPLQIATVLSQQFAARGLQFFKVNKTVTHVAVARPHYLDVELTPVSENVRRIVDYINATPKCTHKQLLEALAPRPVPPPAPASVEGSDATAKPEPPVAAPAELTPEMAAIQADLHWLIHQGHVIEFANGILEMAKKPIVKPPKPAKPSAAPATEGVAPTEAASVAEAQPVADAPTPIEENVPPLTDTNGTPSSATTDPLPAPETASSLPEEKPSESAAPTTS